MLSKTIYQWTKKGIIITMNKYEIKQIIWIIEIIHVRDFPCEAQMALLVHVSVSKVTDLVFEVHLEWALFDGYLNNLKDPIVMPQPFSMQSKLLILHI